MATTTINYLSLTGLQKYDSSIKDFISNKVDAGVANSFKYVNLVDGELRFYTVNPIAEDTVADFSIELPEQDLSHLMQLVKTATSGNIAVFDENGQVQDGGLAVNDIATKEEVQTVQDSVDTLADLVGELPEGTTATSVVDYVNIKTAGIATDAALEELNNQVAGLQTAVQGIQDDYLVEEDKTELQNQITANANAIELLTNGVDSETVDGVNDLIKYVNEHGTEVTEMQKNISDNADAIAAEATARESADTALSGRLDVLEAIDHDAYVEADATLKTELQGKIDDLEKAYKDADSALDTRLVAVEEKAHTHENKEVLDGITADKVTAWDSAEANAKAYVDEKIGEVDLSGIATNATAIATLEGKVTTLEEEVDALQEIEHVEITDEQIDALFA